MRKTMRGMKKAGMSGTMFDREAAMAKVWAGYGIRVEGSLGMKKVGMSCTIFNREAAMTKVWIGCGVDAGISHRRGMS